MWATRSAASEKPTAFTWPGSPGHSVCPAPSWHSAIACPSQPAALLAAAQPSTATGLVQRNRWVWLFGEAVNHKRPVPLKASCQERTVHSVDKSVAFPVRFPNASCPGRTVGSADCDGSAEADGEG